MLKVSPLLPTAISNHATALVSEGYHYKHSLPTFQWTEWPVYWKYKEVCCWRKCKGDMKGRTPTYSFTLPGGKIPTSTYLYAVILKQRNTLSVPKISFNLQCWIFQRKALRKDSSQITCNRSPQTNGRDKTQMNGIQKNLPLSLQTKYTIQSVGVMKVKRPRNFENVMSELNFWLNTNITHFYRNKKK
jgi:hypothetical protein